MCDIPARNAYNTNTSELHFNDFVVCTTGYSDDLYTPVYTVNHKKGGSTFSSITW